MSKRVAIIGGGIAGLTAGWAIQRQRPDLHVSVIEATNRLGGTLQTVEQAGYRIDLSGDMFTCEPTHAIELCEELGHAKDLIATQPVPQRAFVATENGFLPVPRGFSLMLPNDLDAVMRSDLLEPDAKQRFLLEEEIQPVFKDEDESLKSFAVRRYGEEVFERLIQPLVSGIYTADPEKLSMRATMARFLDLEKEHGSLISAARNIAARNKQQDVDKISFADQTASGARYDLFRAPSDGMGQLADWIVADMAGVDFKTGFQVTDVRHSDGHWELVGTRGLHAEFDALVLTVGANQAGQLLHSADEVLANELNRIESASCAIVVLGLDRDQLKTPFDGFGIVVPSYLQRRLIAASFSSNKFAGRAPDGKLLVRCFFGGAMQPELVELADEELRQAAMEELDVLLGLQGIPEVCQIVRWRHSMPQYHLGHTDKIRRIETRLQSLPGLALAGNSYRGVGIPVCIDSGRQAAEKIVRYLT